MADFRIFIIPLDTGIDFSRIQKSKVKRGNKSCSNTLNPISLAISINEQAYISCTIIYPKIHVYNEKTNTYHINQNNINSIKQGDKKETIYLSNPIAHIKLNQKNESTIKTINQARINKTSIK